MPTNLEIQERNRKACQTHYLKGHTIDYTSKKTGLNPTTVHRYFVEFAQVRRNRNQEEFLDNMDRVKSQFLIQADIVIDKLYKKLKSIEKLIREADIIEIDSTELVRLHEFHTKLLQIIFELQSKKSVTEYDQGTRFDITKLLDGRVKEIEKREQRLLNSTKKTPEQKPEPLDVNYGDVHTQ